MAPGVGCQSGKEKRVLENDCRETSRWETVRATLSGTRASTHVSFSEASYEYRIAYVRSLPPTSDAAKPAALELLATALRLPSVFDFDILQKLENVKALGSHELFNLLQMFSKEGLSEYQAWESKNASLLEAHRELPIIFM